MTLVFLAKSISSQGISRTTTAIIGLCYIECVRVSRRGEGTLTEDIRAADQ
jgi:hypothetical protein